MPCSGTDDLKKSFCKNIHFGSEVVWCGMNQMIIYFSKAFIPPSIRSSIHPFLLIILGKLGFATFNSVPQPSRDDLCLLSDSYSMKSSVSTRWVGRPAWRRAPLSSPPWTPAGTSYRSQTDRTRCTVHCVQNCKSYTVRKIY